MLLINTQEKLNEFCDTLQKQPFITVDSEFIREHTYYPQLCLLQTAYDGGAAIIDPLAEIDLSPYFEVLQNPDVIKVFHSGRQDIEIFYNLSGKIPQNVFDTQIAAMACGLGENIGYGNMVHDILHTDPDKSQRLTDWSIRPLDEAQLEYALGDVTYLVDCYKYLRDYLKEHNREEWIKDETAALCDINLYRINPDEAWQRIRHTAHSSSFLAALKYLAAWRERRAQKYNIPRSGILKDDMLLAIAAAFPKNAEELRHVRNIRRETCEGKLGTEILEALKEAAKNPMPTKICRADRKSHDTVPNHEQSLMEILKLLLRILSSENDVVSKLIADDKDLRGIILNQPGTTRAMQGWRYEIFGKYAEMLCRGKLAITYNPRKKRIALKEFDFRQQTDAASAKSSADGNTPAD